MIWANYFDETEFRVPVLTMPGQTTRLGKIGDYVLVNAQIAYDFLVKDNPISVYVQAFNLFDQKVREHPEGDAFGAILLAGVSFSW